MRSQERNREKIRDRSRERYHNDPSVKKKNEARRKREPEKGRARWNTWKAVRDGLLVKGPCEIGGDCLGPIEAHHEDYSKPLEVRWLCKRHHMRLHRSGEARSGDSPVSVFFIGTAHDQYRQRRFPEGSVVIDPWRMIPDQQGVTVRRLGQNRPALISVLVPSRGRPVELMRMMSSAMKMATHQRRVEIIVRLDEDDAIDYLPRASEDSGVRYVIGPRALLSECWNECYQHARGEILMHAGDDITFNTPGWDIRVREEFAKLPDKIGLVFGDDLSTNFPDLATHGFLHRRWVDAVGYFLPPLFSSDWNDVWISEVAKQLGRFVPMPDVVVEHHHYYFGKAERDSTYAEREERGQEDDVAGLFQRTARERAKDAQKLRAVMA